jgi:putative FmdB family regulatory protein
MPLFDFRCRACGHEFEALVRPASYGDPPTACAACGAGDPERLLSTFAVTSREKLQSAADAKNKKAASAARRDTAALEREADEHRHEDH